MPSKKPQNQEFLWSKNMALCLPLSKFNSKIRQSHKNVVHYIKLNIPLEIFLIVTHNCAARF